ncbi:MAG: hypothetical protein OXF55_06505 [Caldilineaceae bacterium]|nr:hypothetical protein [Caldilineaceae bacterium]MDE0181734.1 hypothetical protein [Caldilineaceae bacterium]MDE0428419.1 hypothetical protein [Caldilineaceae bacterium]
MATAAHHARGAPAASWGCASTATSARLRVRGELELRRQGGTNATSSLIDGNVRTYGIMQFDILNRG